MNKAQKAYLESLFTDYAGELRAFTKESFALYADRYNAIDPTPDPETYCIWVISKDNHQIPTYSGYTKEMATESLRKQLIAGAWNSVVEYKEGEYILRRDGARYEVRKEE